MFDESEIKIDLKRSTVLRTWGRDVIFAIDMDNPCRLIEIFKHKYHNEPCVDEQTTRWGYAGYTWTVRVQDFLLDTALNISIKQKKIKCVSALMLLEADTTIKNYAGEDANDLSLRILGQSVKELKRDAMIRLLPYIDPRKFKIIPDQLTYRGIEEEAWRLMQQGMCLYSDKPKSYPGKQSLRGEDSEEDSEEGRWETANARDTNVSSFVFSDNTDLNPRDARLAFRSESLAGVLELLRTQRLRWRGQHRRDLLHQSGLSLLERTTEQSNDEDFNAFPKADGPHLFGLDNLHFLRKPSSPYRSTGTGLFEMSEGKESTRHVVISDVYRNITEISTKSNLKYDFIGDQGAELLAEALKDDHVIERIVLSSARIGDAGAEVLCAAVESMKGLRYLDLSQNCIGDDGANHIAAAIQSALFLERLTVEANRIGITAIAKIINNAVKGADNVPPRPLSCINLSFQFSSPPTATRGVYRSLARSLAPVSERQKLVDQLLGLDNNEPPSWALIQPVTAGATPACLRYRKSDGSMLTIRL